MTKQFILVVLIFILSVYIGMSNETEDLLMSQKQTKLLDYCRNNQLNESIIVEINELIQYHKFTNIDNGFKLVDSLLSIPNINSNDFIKKEIYQSLANLYNGIQRHGMAARYLFKAMNIANNYPNTIANGWTFIEIGNIYYNILQINKAINYFRKSYNYFLEFAKTNSADSLQHIINLGLAVSLENISLSYMEVKNLDSALHYINLSKEYRLKTGSQLSFQYLNLTIAKVFMNARNGDSSLKYYKLSYLEGEKNIRVEDKPQQFNFKIQSMFGIVRSYYLLKNTSEFNKYNQILDSLLNVPSNFRFVIQSLISQSKFFIEFNDFKIAEKYAIHALEIANKNSFTDLNIAIYDNLFNVYSINNDKERAFQYLKLSYKLLDSASKNYKLRSVELEEVSENMESKLKEIDMLNQEMLLNEERIKNQKYFMLVLIISSMMLIIIVVGLINRSRFKTKTMKVIENKNIDLNTTNIELNKSNETKNTLFAIIAHDLKNSIGSVRDAINLLNSEYNSLSDDEKIEFLDLSKKSSDNLYNLLENLLIWSSAQRQALELNLSQVHLKYIAEQSIQLYYSKAKEKNIKLINNLEDDLFLKIDPNQIDTVIRNILNNAVKFTKKDGEIKIYNYQRDNEEIIVIEDNGIGMSKDKADNLFIGVSNKSTYGTAGEKGTGLGLLICKEFIKMHNGKIWAESEEGKGTKVLFTIPK